MSMATFQDAIAGQDDLIPRLLFPLETSSVLASLNLAKQIQRFIDSLGPCSPMGRGNKEPVNRERMLPRSWETNTPWVLESWIRWQLGSEEPERQ
jgi:hypothetical protein